MGYPGDHKVFTYPEYEGEILEKHSGWEPEGGTGVYRRSLFLWRNFRPRWTSCDLLIFLDGQNLFESTQTFDRLHWSGEQQFGKWEGPLLVVGVPASKRRYPEYIGWSQEPGHYSRSGDKHAAFLVDYVVPYLKACFPRARLRGLIGASAGGVAALYTGWRYPKVFPTIGCLSAGRHYFAELLEMFDGVPAKKIYLSCGDRGMDREFLPESKLFAAALKARKKADILCRWHRGDHSEPVWSRRIPDILKFTLG